MEKYLAVIKDIVLCIAALVGAGVAVRGLNAWKHQISGKTEYELAQRVLKATYKFRESIRFVRNPGMFGAELPDPPEDHPAGRSDAHKRWYSTSKAYEARWEKVRTSHIEIEAELLEAEVLWGNDIRDSFSKLFDVEHDLYYKIITYLDHLNPDEREEWTPEEARATRKVLFWGSSDDEVNKRLQTAIITIEKELKPFLKRLH